MKNYRAGVVIPLYMTDFIANTIEYLKNTTDANEAVFCIVNDGVPQVKDYLETLTLPENMYVINLPKNLCYAGSNNAGFNLLMEKYPSIEYLGSLNDDTIVKENWLTELINTLDKHKDVAAASPQLKGIKEDGEEIHTASIFTYGPQCQMLCNVPYISEDAYVDLFGGCCFLCRKEPFIEIGLLDDRYQNGAEDMDLCIKFLTSGYKLMVCAKSHVVHFGGKSRSTRPKGGEEISLSVDLLFRKWGENLTIFNNYKYLGKVNPKA